MAIGNGGLEWIVAAECGKPENEPYQDLFFSTKPEDRQAAKNICYTCPVRADCIRWALENQEIWYTWGGRDENEIRRALSVNAEGEEMRRGRYPHCPYCSARTADLVTGTVQLPEGGRWTSARTVECTVCGFKWRSRTSANAVDAYLAKRAEKFARSEANLIKRREKYNKKVSKQRRAATAKRRAEKQRAAEAEQRRKARGLA